MSEQGKQPAGAPNPFGASPHGSAGLPPPPASQGPAGPGLAPPQPPAEPPSPRRRRPFLLILAAILLVVVSAGAGAAADHEFWAPSPVAAVAPPASSFPTPSSQGGFAGNQGGSSGSGSFGFAPSGSSSSQSASGGPSDPDAVSARVRPALVDIDSNFSYQGGAGAGTGVVISSDGTVVTNNHVISGATQITATDVGNGKTYTAKVVGFDPTNDLAVLQLQGASGLATAAIGDSSKLQVGDQVVGIGNAGGNGGTPTSAGGAITALGQSITAYDDVANSSEQLSGLIRTNANIQPGDSGGALVNAKGEVIGIDTAGSGGFSFNGVTGSAYAIPINEAMTIGKQITSGQGSATVHVGAAAFLGIRIGEPAGAGYGFSQGGGSSTGNGVTVADVVPGEPAEKAGLTAGDVITSLDGHSTSSQLVLSTIMFGHHPGDSVKVGWLDADGQSHAATLELGSGPPG